MERKYYKYSGPVYRFNDVYTRWTGSTWAVSEQKALSQLSYRFKCEKGFCPNTNFKLRADYLTAHMV